MRGVLCILLWLLSGIPSGALASTDPLAAAWKRHEVEFTYMGFTTRYSCQGLRDKMRILLRAAGVRPDFKVSTAACSDQPGRVTPFPRVRMVFYAAELPVAGARDVGEPVAAVWKPVTFAHRQPRGLEIGDCELVEQFRDRVLSVFAVRNVSGDVRCIPHQLSGSSFALRFDMLAGVDADARVGRR